MSEEDPEDVEIENLIDRRNNEGIAVLGDAEVIYVDVPDWLTLGDDDRGWKNVGIFRKKSDALAWIRRYIDPYCDDEGRIHLLTNVVPGENDD